MKNPPARAGSPKTHRTEREIPPMMTLEQLGKKTKAQIKSTVPAHVPTWFDVKSLKSFDCAGVPA